MDKHYAEKQKKIVEPLIVSLANFRLMVFDDKFERHLKGDTSKMSDIEKSYIWFTHVFNELMEKVDLDKYEGIIDEKLFSILKDLYFNMCLFVDAFIKMDEVVLGKSRPSLQLLIFKTRKVYDYQLDVTGDNNQKYYAKMQQRLKELFPELNK